MPKLPDTILLAEFATGGLWSMVALAAYSVIIWQTVIQLPADRNACADSEDCNAEIPGIVT